MINYLTQAAANKAAEEGGLRAASLDSYSTEDRAFYEFWYGHMLDDLMQPPLIGISHSTARYIWDAASRQVANKAEVEPVAHLYKWIGDANDSYEGRVIARSVAELKGEIDMYPESWERIGPLYATPPATTGASTARDHALEDAARACEALCDTDEEGPDGQRRCYEPSRDDCVDTIRALKGSVGASTVLTDERIDVLWREAVNFNEQGSKAETSRRFARAVAREVAAQAGQVAVPGWISVADRLPELQKEVLICCGYLVLGYRTDDKHDPENHNGWVIDFDNGMASPITHWMPLPPSPAKESK